MTRVGPLSLLLLAAIGCHHSPAAGTSLDCTASIATIPMLLNLSWTAPRATTRSWVEFTTADGVAHSTKDAADPANVALTLYGAGPEEAVSWTGYSIDELGNRQNCSGTTTTGPLGTDVPILHVGIDNGDWDPDVNYLLGVFYEMSGDVSHVFVIDRTGRYLWYVSTAQGFVSIDVHVPRDGRGLYFNEIQRDFVSDQSDIKRVDWDGTVLGTTATSLAHHTFTELPDGTLAYQQIDPRDVTGDTGSTDEWIGDAIVEVPPGGEGNKVWSVWDWLTPVWNDYMDSISLYGGKDWTHGNLLSYDDATNHYLLSLAHAATIFDIDRSTMTPSREFGPPGDAFTEGSTPFSYQHTPTWEDDHTLIMFSSPTDGSSSGAFEYTINDDQTLTEKWHHQGPAKSLCLGQALPLPSTHVLINYGCSSQIEEVGRDDGLTRWEIEARPGAGFGQVIPLKDVPWAGLE